MMGNPLTDEQRREIARRLDCEVEQFALLAASRIREVGDLLRRINEWQTQREEISPDLDLLIAEMNDLEAAFIRTLGDEAVEKAIDASLRVYGRRRQAVLDRRNDAS